MFIGVVSHSSWCRILLVLHPSEGASFHKSCFSSCRLAEDRTAANTLNYYLCVAKDGSDFIASWAFYIQEIGLCTRCFFLCFLFSSSGEGWRRSFVRGMFSWGGHHCRKGLTCFIIEENLPNGFFYSFTICYVQTIFFKL